MKVTKYERFIFLSGSFRKIFEKTLQRMHLVGFEEANIEAVKIGSVDKGAS